MKRNERAVGELTYLPTKIEKLTEELCESFGSELLPATDNYPFPGILTRPTKPVVVSGLTSSEAAVLAFQYSRFSPFHSARWREIWKTNARKRSVNEESVLRDLEEKGLSSKAALEDDIVPFLPLANFREAVYVSVFRLQQFGPEGETDRGDIQIEPFDIFEEGGNWNGRWSDCFIKYQTAEVFYVRGSREKLKGLKDILDFVFPAVHRRHMRGLSRGGDGNDLFEREIGDSEYNYSNNRLRPWESFALTRILLHKRF